MRQSELRTMQGTETPAVILLPGREGTEGDGQVLRIKLMQKETTADRKIQSLVTLSDLLNYMNQYTLFFV